MKKGHKKRAQPSITESHALFSIHIADTQGGRAMPEQGVALSLKKIVATSPFLLSAPLM